MRASFAVALAACVLWWPKASSAQTSTADLVGQWVGKITVTESQNTEGDGADSGKWSAPTKRIEAREVVFALNNGALVVMGSLNALADNGMPTAITAAPKGGLVGDEGGTVGQWTFTVDGDTLTTSQVIDKQRLSVKSSGSFRRVKPSIIPGRYALNLSVEILSAKTNGKRWDPMGDAPDPMVTATVYGAGKPRVIKCRQKDTLTANCLAGTIIDVDLNTMIEVKLEDEDAVSHDGIGGIARFWVSAARNKPGKAIPVTLSGALKSASVVLSPAP